VAPPDPGRPFVGSAALTDGSLTSHRLRSGYRRLFPDVYIDAGAPVDPFALVEAAHLWAPAGTVLGGMAAALMHRERWYAADAVRHTVDAYIVGTVHAPRGIRLRRLRRPLPSSQVTTTSGLLVTTPARTAIDVGRWEPHDDRAIAKIDAVCNRSRVHVDEVRALAAELRGVHGLNRVRGLLPWCDRRADSPPETRLRLMLVRAGFPPTPQLVIRNQYGAEVARPDLAYEEQRVAIFYDSELHRRKATWEFDGFATAELTELGWIVIRVTAAMMRNPEVVLRQIVSALRRGSARP